MDLNCARVFAKVVEAGGFSAAGRLLSIPKTTVSKYVHELESDLGLRLLNRTTRKLSLTEAGAHFYKHCVEGLHLMEVAENEARTLQQEPVGKLTIAAPSAIGVPFVMPAITAFLSRYPTMQVVFISAEDLVEIAEQRVEITLWAGTASPPGHSVNLLSKIDIALYASQEYVRQHGAPSTVEELARHDAIAPMQLMVKDNFIWQLRKADEQISITPHRAPRFCSNNPGAVLSALMADQGIAPLPIRYVERVAADAQLVTILPEWRVPPIELRAMIRDGSAGSRAARLFLTFVESEFHNL